MDTTPGGRSFFRDRLSTRPSAGRGAIALRGSVGALLVAVLSGCAGQGVGPGAEPDTTTVTYHMSAEAIGPHAQLRRPIQAAPGFDRPCAADQPHQRRVMPTPTSSPPQSSPPQSSPAQSSPALPSGSADPNSPAERARRVLEQQASAHPIPMRGAVPPNVLAAAQACVGELVTHFNLVRWSIPDRVLSVAEVRKALTGAGMTRIVVRSAPDRVVFAGWNGGACLFGAVATGSGAAGSASAAPDQRGAPTIGITAPGADGTCKP